MAMFCIIDAQDPLRQTAIPLEVLNGFLYAYLVRLTAVLYPMFFSDQATVPLVAVVEEEETGTAAVPEVLTPSLVSRLLREALIC